MKYISLAFHNNEMVVVNGMDVFTAHFCYSKKQRQGSVDIIPHAAVSDDSDEKPVIFLEEIEAVEEDDL